MITKLQADCGAKIQVAPGMWALIGIIYSVYQSIQVMRKSFAVLKTMNENTHITYCLMYAFVYIE